MVTPITTSNKITHRITVALEEGESVDDRVACVKVITHAVAAIEQIVALLCTLCGQCVLRTLGGGNAPAVLLVVVGQHAVLVVDISVEASVDQIRIVTGAMRIDQRSHGLLLYTHKWLEVEVLVEERGTAAGGHKQQAQGDR